MMNIKNGTGCDVSSRVAALEVSPARERWVWNLRKSPAPDGRQILSPLRGWHSRQPFTQGWRPGLFSTAASRLILLTLTVTVLASCAAKKAEKADEEHVVTVDVAPVLSSSISLKVTADALLYPLQQAAIVPKISAPIKKFYVDRGARVREGQLLAELENRDLAGAVTENQANYDQAEANYQTVSKATVPEEAQKSELDVRTAKDVMDAQQKVYDSRQALYKEGAISQKDVNDAQVALTQARNQYEIARNHLANLQRFAKDESLKAAGAQRDQATARLGATEAQLSYSRITSPINGVVTDRPLYAGETAQPGTPLVTVMDVSQVIARAHVAQ